MDHYAATAQSRGGATTATLRRQGSNSFYDEQNNHHTANTSAVGYYGGDRVTAAPQYHPQQQQQFQQQQEPSSSGGGSPSKKFNANKKLYAKHKQRTHSSSSSSSAVNIKSSANKIAITLDNLADNIISIMTTSKVYNIIGLLFLIMTFITIISRYRLSSNPDIAEAYTSLRRYRLGGNHAMELPNEWNDWSLSDFKHEFMCRHHFNRESFSLYTWDQWEVLRTTFNKVVAEESEGAVVDFNKDPVPPTKGYSFGGISGNTPPFYADQTDRGSRGLFASRNIKKGELVHDGTDTDITFPSVQSFRKFMFALPKKDMACDVTEWVWTQRKDEKQDGGKMYIMSVFNIAIYMNDAVEAGKEVNALPKKVNEEEDWWHKLYATKDIEKGEEILTHYAHYDDAWDKVGLGH
jgi:hypothetical protein